VWTQCPRLTREVVIVVMLRASLLGPVGEWSEGKGSGQSHRARLKLRKHASRSSAHNHCLVHEGPTRRCRPSPSCSNLSQSRYTMPCTPPSKCGLFFLSLDIPSRVCQVYECMVRGIAVMRRRADSYVNATQILKVAGVDKGRRTKILEKEILPGKHEIVQGGYGKYQGTWSVQLSV
jgi:hypothetical protein